MRQKVKRYSRSAISILLTLCMLVSCMTVGIIATDAARVDDSVGAQNYLRGYKGQTQEIYLVGDFTNNWDRGNGVWRLSQLNNNEYEGQYQITGKATQEFKFYTDSTDYGNGYGYHSGYSGENASVEISSTGGNMNYSGLDSSKTYLLHVKLWLESGDGNNSKVKITCSEGSLTPWIHYGDNKDNFPKNTGVTNEAMTLKSGNVYQKTLNAGTYYFTIDDNIKNGPPSAASRINSISAGTGITIQNEDYNNDGAKYRYYQLSSSNKMNLEYDKSTGALTVSPVLTNVMLNAFEGGTATVKQGSTTIAEGETKGLQPGSVATVTVKMDNDTDKTDSFRLSSDATNPVTMKYVGDRTYRGTFTVPETASTVNVTLTPKRAKTGSFTVTYQSSNDSQGTVTASVASGASVPEDTLVTFTAKPVKPNEFAGWTGLPDATTAGVTVPVTSNLNVIGNFSKKAYNLVTYSDGSTSSTSTSKPMTQLSNGYYRSSEKVTNSGGSGQFFTVSRTLGNTTTYAKSGLGEGDKWWITTDRPGVSPQHWTSNATASQKYKDAVGNATNQHYVFYDPDTNIIWLSTNPDGVTSKIKIYAKDGALKEANGTDNDTSNWGDTTLAVKVGETAKNVTSSNGGRVHLTEIDAAEAVNPKTVITVETNITRSDAGNYYVYGYDVNGYTVKAEHVSDNKYKATFSVPSIQANINGGIEITPIYLLKEPVSGSSTTTRFYVYNFSGDVKSRWGGTLYCYSYDSNGNYNYGDWPGQPMINLGGGTYYIDLPKGSHSVTLSNASADYIHATILGVKLDGNDTWKTRNMYQCQSYDYDDFDYISKKDEVRLTDEDIVFDFKYKTEGNNFPDATGTNEAAFTTLYPTLYMSDYTNWETLTNFYGDPVDLWGTVITENNLNKNPVRVVVQGYHDTHEANKSYYSTAYVVYVPDNATGDANYTIVNYDGTDRYGFKSRSEFLQKTAAQMTALSDYAGRPVQITYEYAIYDQYSTNGGSAGPNQTAERADGVWYYSQSRPVKSEIKIQYADTKNDIFTDDSFADVTPVVNDKEGHPYKVNQGTTTHAKAFFIDNNSANTHRSSVTTTPPGLLEENYTNRIIEWAYTDGNENFEIKAEESPDGEYSFLGWYKQSGDHVEFVTADYNYSTEAVRGETFIARYVKSPAGQVKLLHSDVEPGSGGTGIRKVEYDIVDGENHTVLDNSEETESNNGAITVPKHYINSHSNYTLKAKFTIESNGNGATNGFYGAKAGGDSNLLTKANFASHNGITASSIQTMTDGITTSTTVVEFSIPIRDMFKDNAAGDKEFDDHFSLLEMFSDFLPTRNITITKTTDVDDYGTAFKIKIYKGTSESDISTPVTDEISYVNAHNENGTRVATDGEYTIYKGDVLTLSGIQDGTYVKVVELKKGTNAPDTTNLYKFDNTVTCTAQANSTSVGTDVRTETEIGTTFRVDGNPVAVTIDNKIQRQNVTITKITNFEEEGSEFTIHVDARLHNSAETARQPMSSTFYTAATVKKDPAATVQDVTSQSSGNFVVKKDGVITFTGVPKGTYLTITEPEIYSYSTITGLASGKTAEDPEPKGVGRFTLRDVTDSNDTVITGGTYKVNDNASLYVNNIVKMTTLKVTKALLDDVTSDAAHKFKLTVKKSGKDSTPTNTTYDKISYESKYNNATTQHTNVNLSDEISIRQGEELTFSVPYGAYITIQETTPAAGFRFYSFDLRNAATTPAVVIDGNTISFQTTDSTATCEICNKKQQTLTINKTVSGLDASDQSFEVLVETGTAQNSLTPYSGAYGGTNSGTGTTTDGKISLKDGEEATITLDYGTYVQVTETVPTSGKYVATYSTGLTFPVQMNSDRTVDITNTVQTKDIKIKKTTDIAEPDQAFAFTVSAVENSNQTAAVDLSGLTCKVYNSDETEDTSATVDKSSDRIAFSLKKDQYLIITGVPVDVKLTINETLSGQGYQLGSVTGATRDGETTSATYVVPKTDPSEIVFNNTKGKTLTIKKTATGGNDDDEFTIHVETGTTLAAYNGNYTLKRGATSTPASTTNGDIIMKRGDEVTISGIAKGTQYRVTEAAATGYMIKNITCDVTGAADYPTSGTVTGKTFTIQEANGEITFDNVKTHDVTITKNLENSNSNQKFQISVDLKLYGEGGTSQETWLRSVAGTETTASLSNMEISEGERIVLKNVPVGAYITVTEATQTNFTCRTITAVDGNSHNITDTDTTNDNVFTFTLGDTDPTITVHNRINDRTVKIAKAIDTGVYPTSGSFTVNVKVNGSNYKAGSITDGNITFSNATPVAITVPLDATVAVAEDTSNMPEGYEYDYTILGTTKVTDNAFTKTFAIADEDNQTITVHNTQLHNLKITKTTNVNNTTDKFTFKAYYKNTSTDSWTVINENIQIVKGETWTSPDKYKTGTLFKVEEVVPAKYSYNATGSSVTGATASTPITNGFENITMGSADVTVTVDNTVKTKNVTISKTADYTETASGAFTFNVKTKAEGASTASNCTYPYKLDGAGEEKIFTDGNVTLESGQSIVIYNVPVDTEVTVRETNAGTATSTTAVISDAKEAGSYNSATKTAVFTVGATANPSVAFTNSKNKTLTITKTKPSGDSDVNDTTTPFYFEVIKTAGGNFDGAYTLSNLAAGKEATGRWNSTNNRYTVYMGETITISVQSAEIYTIKEVAIPANYTLTSVTGDGDNINESSKTVGKTVTIGSSNASVTFENTIKRANVTVQKLVPDYNSGDDEFPITVSYTKPGMAEDYETYNLKKNATSSELTLPYGTQVTVSENLTGDMAKKYKLATGGIKYTVAGSEQQTGTSFTMTDKNVAVTVTNERKPYTVTVGKVVSGDNTDSTEFKVNVNSAERPISQGHPYTYTAYYGDTVTVSETNIPRGYALVSISDGTTPVTSGNYSTTVTGNTNITVTNTKLPTYTLTLTKEAGSEADNTEFGITVSSATANGNYSYKIGSDDAVEFDTNSKVIKLKAGQSAVISGLLAGETLSFEETEQGTSAGYTFDHFTVNNVEQQSSVTELSYTVLAGTNEIVVHNVKSTPDKYHYRIEYTYPSRKQYVKTTDADGNEMQVLGEPMYGDQSYFVEGDLLSNDPSFSSYFDASANDGKGAITQEFIASLPLPNESNFMQDITWDTTKAATYVDFGVETDSEGNVSYYTAKLKYSVEDTSKKTVKFMFPYAYQQVKYDKGSLDDGTGVVYIPTSYSDAAYLGNNEDYWQKTEAKFVTYQNEFIAWKVESRLKENSETEYETYNQYYHTTAPSTIKNNGETANFLYWSIRSYNKSTGNYEEIARSHNPIFNYTIFDDYLIIPVYSCFNPAKYDLSDETEFNTSKTAWLNLLDITRNQWNNDAKGTESTSRHGKDTIYVDFDLAFCFNGYQLNKKTNAVDTGLLIEDCGELDAEHQLNLAGDETTYKNDVAYYQGEKTADVDAIKTFIRGNLVKGGVGSKSGGDYIKYTIGKSLTNKNRMELGVINTVRAIEESEEDHIAGWTMTDETKRTHVFRAYSYVTRTAETGDTAVYLSEPVYFTLKNISEM